MKKLKGFTLVELVVVMAITITMAGVTLSSNIYNEKEAINNVAVKCQTLIEAAFCSFVCFLKGAREINLTNKGRLFLY